jgi:hypothetical protein
VKDEAVTVTLVKGTFVEGRLAARQGVPFYANPYSKPADNPEAFHWWFAGWCYQKNRAEEFAAK